MTNYSIQLDFSHELTFGQLLDDIQPFNLTAQIIELCGPAGGNPLISLSSPNKSDIINYLNIYCQHNPTDIEYLSTFITQK